MFLGLEYILIVYLIRFYFKENNIKDQVKIKENELLINKFKGDKLFTLQNIIHIGREFFLQDLKINQNF